MEHIIKTIDTATNASNENYMKTKEIKVKNMGRFISNEEKEAVIESRKLNYLYKQAKSNKNISSDLLTLMAEKRKEGRKRVKQI